MLYLICQVGHGSRIPPAIARPILGQLNQVLSTKQYGTHNYNLNKNIESI